MQGLPEFTLRQASQDTSARGRKVAAGARWRASSALTLTLALALSAPFLAATTDDVRAEGFFKRLFNPQVAAPTKAVEQDRQRIIDAADNSYVPAPKYFTYKADPLVPVDFKDLAKVTTAAVAAPVAPAAATAGTAEAAPAATPAPDANGVTATPATDESPAAVGTDAPAAPATVQLTAFDQARPALADLNLTALKEVGSALVTFYREHPDFVWVTDGRVNERAQAVLGGLAAADAYGLDPQDYLVEMPNVDLLPEAERAAALMGFEMALSKAALTYMLDAERGRVDPNRISGYHDLPRHKVDLVAGLKGLAAAPDALAALVSHQPDNAPFKALASELARLRAEDANADPIVIAPGTLIKPGQSNPELKNVMAAIRKNGSRELQDAHAETILAYQDGEEYTPALVELVKGFQKENGLSADGVIGKNSVRALVGETNVARIAKVELAMERLRWLPETLGERRVFINQPAYTATYYEPGSAPLSMRAVVGKKSNQTNFFYDKIEYVEYNPYWGVPYSIIVNEMLPKLARDPSYLDNAGYEVTTANGRQVSSASVDWHAVATKKASVNVRQYPGASNALGELKILFPNKHHIYMHDTPSRNLFSRDERAFSHGCVRLQDPRAMAAAVLGKSKDYVSGRIAQGQNDQDNVTADIPVYVAYFTAWPQDDGKIGYFSDVYDRDMKLLEAIKTTDQTRG